MIHRRIIARENESVGSVFVPIGKRLVIIGVFVLAATIPAIAQNSELQQKLAAVKQASAENKQRLRQYQWIESTQLTLKGDAKPPTQKLCQYGPDGFKRPQSVLRLNSPAAAE